MSNYPRVMLGNACGCICTKAMGVLELGTGCSLLQPLGLDHRLPSWATMAKGGGMP